MCHINKYSEQLWVNCHFNQFELLPSIWTAVSTKGILSIVYYWVIINTLNKLINWADYFVNNKGTKKLMLVNRTGLNKLKESTALWIIKVLHSNRPLSQFILFFFTLHLTFNSWGSLIFPANGTRGRIDRKSSSIT